MKRHPIQEIYKTDNGIFRFRENKIVNALLDNSTLNMNNLAVMNFSNNDREQFAQLIGYSLGGFSELNYVSFDTYELAERIAISDKTEQEVEIEYLKEQLEMVRKLMKDLIPNLFKIHPDDLEY